MTKSEADAMRFLIMENAKKQKKINKMEAVLRREYKEIFNAYIHAIEHQAEERIIKYHSQLEEIGIIFDELGLTDDSFDLSIFE